MDENVKLIVDFDHWLGFCFCFDKLLFKYLKVMSYRWNKNVETSTMLVYLRVILNGQFIYNCELYHHHHQSDFFIKKVKH